MTTHVLAALAGMVVVAGLLLAAAGVLPAREPLADALRRLDALDDAPPGRSRLAVAVPLLPGQEAALALRGQSRAAFGTEKLIMAGVGLAAPAVGLGFASWLFGLGPAIPVGVGLLGALIGWFVPDLQLARGSTDARSDASEALFTFFDLVTLERLANSSAAQALANAAQLSDAPLFRRIRGVLERARLEQRPPYADLRRLGDELSLPQLGDIADVMGLDQTGASLADALRARVRELRDAHLNRAKVAAHEVNERLTVWMVLPAFVFGAIFLAPPILRLLGG